MEQEQWDAEMNSQGERIMKIRLNFPGEKDQGTPVIIRENRHKTIIGMFLRIENNIAIMAQLSPSTVNWIRLNADWTQESTCDDPNWRKENLFTSCSCGMSKLTNEVPRRRNRIYNGEAVNNNNQYPWLALVANDRSSNPGFINNNPNGNNFEICSGSIISNKHILTSAECLLKNQNNKQEGYSEKDFIRVKIGHPIRHESVGVKRVKQVIPHEKALTDGYNYNIGNCNEINDIVKLREREGQGVDPGRSLKGHLWMVDGGWWISFP